MTGINLSRAAKQTPESTNGNPDYISETDNDAEQVPKTDSIPPRTLVDKEARGFTSNIANGEMTGTIMPAGAIHSARRKNKRLRFLVLVSLLSALFVAV